MLQGKNIIDMFKRFLCLTLAYLLSFSSPVYSLPQISEIVNGEVDYQINGNTMTINAANDTIINYNWFNIEAGETVIINLPDSSSRILNRVVDNSISQLMGNLQSNGLVILINPNGIYVGSSANITASSIILSTRDIDNQDFLDKNYSFKKLSNQQVDRLLKNMGTINVSDGGFGVLIAGGIDNQGKIFAPSGTIALASGDALRLDIAAGGLISVAVDAKTASTIYDFDGNPISQQINNSGTLDAAGGTIIIKAESLPEIFSKVINITGEVNATAATVGTDGRIILGSSGGIDSTGILRANQINMQAEGAINTMGTIIADRLAEAGAAFNIGGTFQVGESYHDNLDNAITYVADTSVSGAIDDIVNIVINSGVTITLTGNTVFTADSDMDGTGAFLMDSTANIAGGGFDLTIRGSQASTIGNISNVDDLTLQESQGASNPTFTSSPTSTTWSNIDGFTITSGKLNRFTGAGTGGSPYLIYDVYGLQAMNGFLTSTFGLANDIDASTTNDWNAGLGFNPVGDVGANFTGDFDGNNYVISDLYINRPLEDYVGLFGITNTVAIQDVGLTDADITGRDYVGGLVGSDGFSSIDNSYTTGSINGNHIVGGLLGDGTHSSISDSYSAMDVTGTGSAVGGLMGNGFTSFINNSYATGAVTGIDYVGGIVGYLWRGNVVGSYATGNITGDDYVGGLAGNLFDVGVIDSYATGDVTGVDYVGGLIGVHGEDYGAVISSSYSQGNVSGNHFVGGLVGVNGASLISSFSTGVATSSGDTAGGLIGSGGGTLTNNWWYNATNSVDIGFTGNVADAQIAKATATSDFYNASHAVYTGATSWNFSGTWGIINNYTLPYLDALTAQVIYGTAYSDAGTTGLNNAGLVLTVNGTSTAITTSLSGGKYAFFLPTALVNGDDLLLYIDGNAVNGNTVTTANTADIGGFDVYGGAVIGRNDNAGTLTNAVFTSALGSLVDTDIDFSLSGSNLTLDSGVDFILWGGETYTPGGNLSTNDLTISSGSTLNAGSNSFTIGGALTNSGTFNSDTSTFTFNSGSSEVFNVTDNFYNLAFNNGSGTWTLGNTLIVDNDFTITNGTVNAAGYGMTVGKNFTNAGTFTHGNNTVTFDGTGNINAGASSLYNANFNGTSTLAGALDVDNHLVINGSLSAAGYGMTVGKNFTNAGTFTHGNNTVTFDGTGNINAGASSLYNANFNGTSTLVGALDVDNHLAINGSLSAVGYGMTLGGNWSNGGTFTHGNNTVTLDGTNQSISGNTTFYNLSKIGSGDTLTFAAGSTQTVSNVLTLQGSGSGQLTAKSSSGGSQWNVNGANYNLSYVSLQDSHNTNGQNVILANTNTNVSNNTGWTFQADLDAAARAAELSSVGSIGAGVIPVVVTSTETTQSGSVQNETQVSKEAQGVVEEMRNSAESREYLGDEVTVGVWVSWSEEDPWNKFGKGNSKKYKSKVEVFEGAVYVVPYVEGQDSAGRLVKPGEIESIRFGEILKQVEKDLER